MTIVTQPSGTPTAHGDVIYTVTDAHAADPVTYPNYKYIADIYVDGVMIERVKKFPLPSNNIGVFNIGSVIRSYLIAVFAPTAALQSFELGRDQFYIDVQVKFGEEYSYTEYFNLATSNTIKHYNYYNRQFAGDHWAVNSLITNAPRLDSTLSQSNLFLSYFPNSTGAISVDIKPDNGSTYSTTITPSTAYFGQILNVSPTTINALSANKINAATQYYDVTVDGETIRVNLQCEPRFDTYQIHFLNQYGGYDSKLFNKVSRQMVSITKSSFEKLAYAVDDSGNVAYYTGSVYNETGYVYASQFSEKWLLNSDLLTDAEYEWLYDLIVSPQVFIYLDTYFIPVKITDTNYEIKKRANDRELSNLTINIEFGKNFNAQYR